MKHYLTSIILFGTIATFGQKAPDYGLFKIRLTDSGTTTTAEISPVSTTTTAKRNLLYYWYGSGKIHSLTGGFSGKLLNGSYMKYNANHEPVEAGHFTEGLKNGIFKEWSDQGKLIKWVTWKKGVLDGAFFYYNTDGNPLQSGTYKHDMILDGIVINYRGKDSVERLNYKNGRIIPPDTGTFWKWIHIFKRKAHA